MSSIQAWCLSVDEGLIGHGQTYLSKQEVLRGEKFSTKRKQEYLLGRILLRSALSHLIPEVAPQDWKIAETGQPIITSIHNIKASLSHSGKLLCCVVAQNVEHLGSDIEQPSKNRKLLAIAKHWFTEGEYQYLSNLAVNQQHEHFYQLWTAKEAYLKALGVGISGGLDRLQAIYEQSSFAGYGSADVADDWCIVCANSENYYISLAVAQKAIANRDLQIAWKSSSDLFDSKERNDYFSTPQSGYQVYNLSPL